MKKERGRVYIVRNPAFPHLFKIGMTTKPTVEERGLNASNVPEDFETICAYECDNPVKLEGLFHDTFADYRHFTATKRKTEFFYIVCLEKAVRWIETLTDLDPTLTDVTDQVRAEEELDEEINMGEITDNAKNLSGRRPNTTFAMVDIPIGTALSLDLDKNAVVKTVDNRNTVELNGENMSISAAVNKLMKERGKEEKNGFSGPLHFMYEGENIFQRRLRMEKEGLI